MRVWMRPPIMRCTPMTANSSFSDQPASWVVWLKTSARPARPTPTATSECTIWLKKLIRYCSSCRMPIFRYRPSRRMTFMLAAHGRIAADAKAPDHRDQQDANADPGGLRYQAGQQLLSVELADQCLDREAK